MERKILYAVDVIPLSPRQHGAAEPVYPRL